jgi:ABC-2 type transport system ATP-binding protein
VIDVKSISKQYGDIQALDNIRFHIEEGDCFGLVGPNGAGKSTLMKILAGILLDFQGDMEVNNWSVSKDRLKIKQRIGYVPQEICLEDTLTAKDNLILFGHLYELKGKELQTRIDEVLNQIGLKDRAKDKISTFSGGMKRRLNIGCALLHKPSIIIMDEPTVGIDPQSRNSIFSIIQEQQAEGSTIIYSSHYMEEVEHLCDSIGLIDNGKLAEFGRMEELLEKHASPSLFIAGEGIDEDSLQMFGKIERKGNGYLLNSENPLSTLEKVAVHCREQDIHPYRLELYQPRLEDIFFHLTGTQLRDM